MPDHLTPSGRQLQLRLGTQQATVVTVGAGLRTYDVDSVPVIDGYDTDSTAPSGRGQTLIPWPNRVRDGLWQWRGRTRQLALTEPTRHNAIHGLVRWMGWEVRSATPTAVTLGVTSWPQPGYEWTLHVQVTYELGPDGLAITQSVTNDSDTPAPVAAGSHPYLQVANPTIDTALLQVPAATRLVTDEQGIPVAAESVTDTPYDFRTARAIGSTRLDDAFTDLQRDDDGRIRVRLSAPDDGRAVTLWADENYAYVQVFTGDTLPDESRRRKALAVEPMTAPPNALASGESLRVLEPRSSWTGTWGIAVS